MKLKKLIMSVFTATIIFSCTTTKEMDEPVVEETLEVQEVESVVEKKMVEVEVEETIYYVTKEEAYYGDGQIDTITNYSYDESFNLLNRVQTNEQGEVLESFVNTYAEGLLSRQDHYGFNNQLNMYLTFAYDGDGNITTETMFDSKDKVQSINEYEYENGKVKTWITRSGDGGILAITDYSYDDSGNNTLIEMKDAGSVIDGTIEKSYNDGLLVEEMVKSASGDVEKSASYIYDGEQLTEKVYFDSKGKKRRSESFEFDGVKNVPDRINLHYKSGNLEAYTMVEYDYQVIVKTVMVEE